MTFWKTVSGQEFALKVAKVTMKSLVDVEIESVVCVYPIVEPAAGTAVL